MSQPGAEGAWALAFLLAVTLLVAVLPIARLAHAALFPSGGFNGTRLLAEMTAPAVRTATWNTLEVSTLSALIAMALGMPFAFALTVTDVRAKRPLALALVLSLLVAPQVAALAYKSLLGPGSTLLGALGIAPPPGTPNPLLGRGGIIAVLGLHHAPLVALTLAVGIRSLPRGIFEAAQIDGAGPRAVARWIVLPLLAPHLAGAVLLAFVAAVGNFGIPALLGLPAGYTVLPTLIYRRLAGFGASVLSDAAALSMIVALIAALAIALRWQLMRGEVTTLDRDGTHPPQWRLGRWRPLVEMLLWGLIVLVVVLPLLSLLATALAPAYGVRLTSATATLEAFREILWRQPLTVRALKNSILFAGLAGLIIALLAVAVGYALDRHAARLRSFIEGLIDMPYALPGVVLAVAAILLLLKPLPLLGVSLYATPWIIILAYISRFLSLALKPVLAAMAVLDRAPEEAAAVDGASAMARLRYIVLPNVLPSAAAGALLAILIAFNELTVSALLWTAGTETLGVALYNLEEAGLAGPAAAIALVAILVVVVIVLTLDRFSAMLPDDALPWQALAVDSRPRAR